jgi:hypothetical protein
MQGKALIVPGTLNRVAIALVRFVPAAVLLTVIERRQSQRKAA